MPDASNTEQIRIMADAVAKAAVLEYARQHPEGDARSHVPAPVKWAGGIAAAVMTALAIAGCVWLFSTVSDVQITVARMDERLRGQVDAQDSRFSEIDRRLSAIEGQARGMKR